MVNVDPSTAGDSVGRGSDLDARSQELKSIREWSFAVERNPDAFGPSINKQRAIKLLIEALDEAQAAKSGDEVSKALEELREMVPGERVYIEVNAGNYSENVVNEARILIAGRSRTVAPTLTKAMAKVREWKKEQK